MNNTLLAAILIAIAVLIGSQWLSPIYERVPPPILGKYSLVAAVGTQAAWVVDTSTGKLRYCRKKSEHILDNTPPTCSHWSD